MVVTNSSGAAVEIGEQRIDSGIPPNPLPANASLTFLDAWNAGSGTEEYFRIYYPDRPADKPVVLRIYNPAMATPAVETYKWGTNKSGGERLIVDQRKTMGENLTWVTKVEGKQITINSLADDGDNKNWTMTLDS